MISAKNKISIRQAMIMFLVSISSATIGSHPNAAARVAHQAAWLTPVVTLAQIIPVIFVLNSIFKKYKEESFTEVIEDIFGAVFGKIVTVFFAFYLTIVLSLIVRHFSENFASSIFPNTNIIVFAAVILFSASLVVRKGGIVVLARMSEIMIVILVLIFFLLCILAGKDMEIDRLTPISFVDFLPVLKSSIGPMYLWAHFTFIFLFGNYINNKEKLLKVCTGTAFLGTFLTIITFALTVGVLGASTTEVSTQPFLLVVKLINVFETIERIEAAVISMWMLSDFMLIAIFLFTVLNLYKLLFRLSDIKPLCSIYPVIVFLMGLMWSKNIFELQAYEQIFSVFPNIFLGYILPILVFIVGKVRKKI